MLDNRPTLPPEIARRRTFAIISHPDAGKTTLTEKFLLFGGATIQQFIAILLIGLTSGTYSSIFNAVPLLVSWERGEIPFVNQGARA